MIARLGLQPHPEGGWYREVHRSAVGVRRLGDGAERSGLTVILFLLPGGAISRWHRVAGADELWQHAGGAPLDLWRLPPEGGRAERLVLGAAGGAPAEATPLAIVPAGWWQAACSRGAWTLCSCAVGPGFDFDDFLLLKDLPIGERPAGADPALL